MKKYGIFALLITGICILLTIKFFVLGSNASKNPELMVLSAIIFSALIFFACMWLYTIIVPYVEYYTNKKFRKSIVLINLNVNYENYLEYNADTNKVLKIRNLKSCHLEYIHYNEKYNITLRKRMLLTDSEGIIIQNVFSGRNKGEELKSSDLDSVLVKKEDLFKLIGRKV